MAKLFLRPTSDYLIGLNPSIGVLNYAMVNEVVTNDSTYNSIQVSFPGEDFFGFPHMVPSHHTVEISSVKLWVRAKHDVVGFAFGAFLNSSFGASSIVESVNPSGKHYICKQTHQSQLFNTNQPTVLKGNAEVSWRAVWGRGDPSGPAETWVFPHQYLGEPDTSQRYFIEPPVYTTDYFYNYSFEWAINPRSGLAWTPNDLNGIGLNHIDHFGYLNFFDEFEFTHTFYVSQCYLEITYDIGFLSPLPTHFRS